MKLFKEILTPPSAVQPKLAIQSNAVLTIVQDPVVTEVTEVTAEQQKGIDEFYQDS